MQRREYNAADAPAPAGQYTQAIEVIGSSRTLYISGQVGVSADGSIPDDAETQAVLAAQLAGTTSRGGYGYREPRQDHDHRPQRS